MESIITFYLMFVISSVATMMVITFYLMFVISSVATDDRAMGQLAGVAIGSTILLNAMFAGPVSGASMNPARSIGPALVWNQYKGLWVYILGPTIGAIGGAWAYNTMRFKPSETTKGDSGISKIYMELYLLNKQVITQGM
ncbi:putative major intrinsic protein [Helianthus anomalus]